MSDEYNKDCELEDDPVESDEELADSIEEKIHKLQEEKRNLSEQVIQGEANMLSSMSREDFLSLLEG